MARISIVIPVYNNAEHLEQCLNSVLCQTWRDIEVICIDDGSTDDSAALLNAYAARDERVRVISQQNAGASAARNTGVDAASGDWVMFVDADDHLAPQACEKAHAVADTTGADIVVFGGSTFPQDLYFDKVLHPRNTVVEGGVKALFEETGSLPFVWNKLFSRALLHSNQVRFDASLALGEDNAFQFAAFPYASRVAFCQDELYHYRYMRQDSAVSRLWADQSAKMRAHLDVVASVLADWQRKGILECNQERIASWAVNFLHDDVKLASFDERCSIADELGALFSRYGMDTGVLDGRDALRAAFLLEVRQATLEAAAACLVVFAEPGTKDVAAGFVRVARQLEQRIQILCIDPFGDDASFAELEEAAAGDARAQVLRTKPDDAVVAALAAAKAPFIQFCSVNDEYEDTLVKDILDVASRNPADIYTYFDYFHSLRLGDVGRLLLSFETTGSDQAQRAGSPPPYSAADCPEHIYDYCSLSWRNKMFDRAFLARSGLAGLREGDIALCLEQASSVVSVGGHYVKVNPLSRATDADARRAGVDLCESFRVLEGILREIGIWDERRQAWANALLSSASTCIDSFTGPACEALVAVLRDGFDELLPPDTFGPDAFFSKDDYEALQVLRSSDVRTFIDWRSARRIRGMEDYCRFVEQQRDELEVKSHLDETFSYRLGHALTAPARALRARAGK